MAGHSKWANIRHKKGAADAKRGKIFSKIAKEITVAVRIGGPEADSNPRLRSAITLARSQNMPNDNIDRAIKKGTGELGGDIPENLVYEGYGAEGVAILVECLSDNRNRSATDIRTIFNKNNGSLGNSGTVAWMFERKAQFILEGDNADEEKLLETVLDAGAEDFTVEDGMAEVLGPPECFENVSRVLEEANMETVDASVTMLPENSVKIEDVSTAKKILGLIDALDNNDDVQNVYSNHEIDEQILEQATS